MRQLVVVRHGHLDPDQTLNEYGKIKIAELGQRLKPFLVDHAVRVVTSLAAAAADSAKILAKIFDAAGPKTIDLLFSDAEHPPDIATTVAAILKEGETADALIVMTHHDQVRALPSAICERTLGRAYPEQTLSPATAILIVFDTRKIHYLR